MNADMQYQPERMTEFYKFLEEQQIDPEVLNLQLPEMHEQAFEAPLWVTAPASELAGLQIYKRFRTARRKVRRQHFYAKLKFFERFLQAEGHRLWALTIACELLLARRQAKHRVEKILNECWNKGTPYILYLRNFSLGTSKGRISNYKKTQNPMADAIFQTRVQEMLAPLCIIKLQNQEELYADIPGIEISSSGWQTLATTLITEASAIILYCESMTPGVSAEIDMILSQGRAQDTWVFIRDEQTREMLPPELCHVENQSQATDEAWASIRKRSKIPIKRCLPIPRPENRWFEGAPEIQMNLKIEAALRMGVDLLQKYKIVEGIDLVCGTALSYAVLLDDFGRLATGSFIVGSAFDSIGAPDIAAGYYKWAVHLFSTINDPDMLAPNQAYALACIDAGFELETFRDSALTAMELLPPGPSPEQLFTHHFIAHWIYSNEGDDKKASYSRESARQAYATLRSNGEYPVRCISQAIYESCMHDNPSWITRAIACRKIKRDARLRLRPGLDQLLCAYIQKRVKSEEVAPAVHGVDEEYELAEFCRRVENWRH
jgi:hypothetical protein